MLKGLCTINDKVVAAVAAIGGGFDGENSAYFGDGSLSELCKGMEGEWTIRAGTFRNCANGTSCMGGQPIPIDH